MGVTASEWTMLSLLLNHKLPNSRTSELTLSDEIRNIGEVKEILNSLERKGIIKIEEMFEPSMQKKEDKVPENYKELEKINLLYIIRKINATEYERRFFESSSKTQIENKRDIIPLTYIERYISLSRLLHTALKLVNSKSSPQNSPLAQLDNFESLIQRQISQIHEKILDIFSKYLAGVKKEVEARPDKIVVMFIYLYPFLKCLINEKKLIADENSRNGIIKEIEELKKSIEVEREIIHVLSILKEDEQKIRTHRDKLHALEDKLNELSRHLRKEGLVVEFLSDEMNISRIKNKLLIMLRRGQPVHESNIEGFIDDLSNLLYNELSGKLLNNNELHLPINEILGEDVTRRSEKDYYLLKVSLIWINDLCPVMLDSIIESDGKELSMCKNPECFVVYHKKCLEKLLRTNVATCLICGSPIT